MLQCPSLNQRIYKSKLRYPLQYPQAVTDSRSKKFKKWSEDIMEKAINAVINDGVLIRHAAEDYGIPKSTLGDRISGRILPGSSSGPRKLLTTEEEEDLVAFLRRCAAIGYPKSRKDLMELVQRILEGKGIEHQVSNGWWRAFCKRNPNLTLRAPATL